MDLVKIGKYIAGKRKDLGLTQKQLADKLGMSDKSVSKWERGICLPDVSIYVELCNILGISINEFIAGEDISEENIIKKSENNLIQITEDSTHKQHQSNIIIIALLIISIITIGIIGVITFNHFSKPSNCIEIINLDNTEMHTINYLTGIDEVYLFQYSTNQHCKKKSTYISLYHSGKLIYKERLIYGENISSNQGTITVVPNFEESKIRLIHDDDNGIITHSYQILENVKDKKQYVRGISQIKDRIPIKFNQEQNILALIYGKGYVRDVTAEELASDSFKTGEDDYIYVLSIKFEK